MGQPEQIVLLDLAPDYWVRLQRIKDRLMMSRVAPNSQKAYAFMWAIFADWCESVGLSPLPATPETVSDFVTWALYERQPKRYRLATVKLTLTAIANRHREHGFESPADKRPWGLVRNAARDLKEKPGGKEAMTPHLLRRLCAKVGSDGSLVGVRDRAMFLLQFAAGWRCSEIVSLDDEDVRFVGKGMIVTLGASKCDQDASEGRIVGIEYGEKELTCPVRAMRAWRQVRGKWPGPLFCFVGRHNDLRPERLHYDRINTRLKEVLEDLGVDPLAYGSHSFRAGMVTTAIERGASETIIMLRTGQKRLDTMRRYVRSRRVFKANPLAGVL